MAAGFHSIKDTVALRKRHDTVLQNAQDAAVRGDKKKALELVSLAKQIASQHNVHGARGQGQVGANYDTLEKRYGGAEKKGAAEDKPAGTVKTGARGGQYIETSGGKKYYIGASGGKAVVRRA